MQGNLNVPVEMVLEMALRSLRVLRDKQRAEGALGPEEEERVVRLGRLVLDGTKVLHELQRAGESISPEDLGLTDADLTLLEAYQEESAGSGGGGGG